VPPLHVGDHTLERRPVRPLTPISVPIPDVDLLVGPVQDDVPGLGPQPAPGRVRREPVSFGHRVQDSVPVLEPRRVPRCQGSLSDRPVGVGHHQLGVHLQPGPQSVTGLAGAIRRVEREVAGHQLVEGEAVVGAGQLLRKRDGLFLAVGLDGEGRQPLGQVERGLDRIGHPTADVRPGNQPVHDHVDVVFVVPIQSDRFRQVLDLAVHPRPDEALGRQVLEQTLVLPLPPPDHRCQDLEPGSLGEGHDLVHDLVGGLPADRPAALWTVRVPHPGVQDPKVVVDLGDGAHRRSRVPGRGLLVDRDRGR
jgi:hypothetical protein